MNYNHWLKIECPGLGGISLTEERAKELALPVDDPGTETMKKIRKIVIHHSATSTGNARAFRVLHRGINKWNDIGYHFVIGNGSLSADGEVETGRILPFRGAHAKGANGFSVGVCLVGNFNEYEPTAAQLKSLVYLLNSLMIKYDLSRDSIDVHRLVKGSCTECPGKHLSLEKILNLIGE